MRFRNYIENEMDQAPEMGADSPASAEVKRTDLQPQVDAHEIDTKSKREQDKILAVDGSIERLDVELPDGDDKSQKMNHFKKLWDELKQKWDQIKMSDYDLEQEDETGAGLGQQMGDEKYRQQMQQHMNMVPGPDQPPAGPGTFGVG